MHLVWHTGDNLRVAQTTSRQHPAKICCVSVKVRAERERLEREAAATAADVAELRQQLQVRTA